MSKRNNGLHYDVIVVGAGYAGLAAALEASKANASVIVLGRGNPFASNSALGGGAFALVGTPLQKEMGIRDSAELFAEDILKANRHTIPQDVVMAAAQQSVQLYEWMTKLGAQFYEVTQYRGHSVARVHVESGMHGANFLRLLLKTVMSIGADVRLGMVAEHLMLNKSNEVDGVQADDSGKKILIRAKRAVVLAAGGFGKTENQHDGGGLSCPVGAE